MLAGLAKAGALVAVVVMACHRGERPPAPAALFALPDSLAGFTAGPAVAGDTFVRRTYARGATRIDVTLAHAIAPLGPGGFAGWLEITPPGFPQPSLTAPPAQPTT